MGQPPPPFACTFTPNLPELLQQLNCTMAISTYQAGKVLLISAKNENELVQLPRSFDKAMGLAVANGKMAVATRDEVIHLVNSPGLAASYPRNPNVYDAMFVPRATYYTGHVDIHDLHWGTEGLWAVNTSFSCLCLINEDYSFTPKWRPDFISKLASEDRCHLNGMAMENGKPKYVSALGTGDKPQSWRENITSGGVLIDVDTNSQIASELAMPHSPRLHDGKIFLLCSASGDVLKIDPKNGEKEVIANMQGFVRGMAIYGDYMFIGLSKLRQNSSTFKHLPIAKLADTCGISILHIPTAAIVAQLKYQSSVDEIYDVQILPGLKRPGILNTKNEVYKLGLSTPDATYWAVDALSKKENS